MASISTPNNIPQTNPLRNRRAVAGDGVAQPPSDTDQTADIGTDTHALDNILGALSAQSLGTDTESLVVDTFAGTFPIGTDTDSFDTPTEDGIGTANLGTNTDNISNIIGVLSAQPTGTNTVSMTASGMTTVTDYIDTGSTPGGSDWQNPTNSEGTPDGSIADISVTAAAVPDTASGTLTMSYGLPAAPAGTRGDVILTIRQRVDTTMALLSSADCELIFEKSTGSNPLTVFQSVRATTSPIGDINVRNDGALTDYVVDVTSHVSAWTEAELSSARLRAVYSATAVVAGGDSEWEIDSIAMARDYTQATIP